MLLAPAFEVEIALAVGIIGAVQERYPSAALFTVVLWTPPQETHPLTELSTSLRGAYPT